MSGETARGDTPPQVRRAVVLLWVALALSIAQWFLDAETLAMADEPGFDAVFWGLVTLSYGATAVLIHFTARAKNWARILLLLGTVAGTGLMLFPWEPDYYASWTPIQVVSAAAFALLDFVALYWLFTGEANAWFRPRPAGQPLSPP